MAARNPPLWLQAGSHPATNDRLLLEALMAPPPAPVSGAGYGIVAPGDLAVTENGTPNMSVNVAAGKVFIDGTENANQGAYLAVNDATVNLAIAASNPTNPRKDLVVAKVQDAEWSGATNSWSLAVVTGTPAASPAEPAVPANAFVLAMVDVPAADTAITNSQITDRRRRGSALGGIVVCTSTTRPASPFIGQVIYETDTDRSMVWNGASWKQLGLTYDPPAARVVNTAGQSIPNSATTNATFNAEAFDTDNMANLGTNNDRLTIVSAGVYVLTGMVYWGAAAAGVRRADITQNANIVGGSAIGPNNGGDNFSSNPSALVKAAAGDVFQLLLFQTSGGAISTLGSFQMLSAVRVARG